jgi:allantoinase
MDHARYLGPLPDHGRFPYRPITRRPAFRWPGGAGLAVYIGFNLEHFAFGEGLGAGIGPASPAPDVLNHSWREYGNRVGAWRCLELFDELALPTAALVNTALYDHCPELVAAFAAGWLSPWISESRLTPDLLAETGYTYTLNWCHDDQPQRMATRCGRGLWAVPYPQELNDIPMIVARQMDAKDFAQMIVDQFDEMRQQARRQALVMGIALHPYLVGQPYRLRHLRRALAHVAAARDDGDVWLTTPGAIGAHAEALAAADPQGWA